MKRSLFILSTLVCVIVILSIVHVIVSNVLSTTGVELDAVQTDLIQYKKENVILREQVLEHASLYSIASAAAQMGFVPSKTTVSIKTPLPMAKR